MNTLTPLKWDSKFFGYPVALVEFNQSNQTGLGNLLEEIDAKGFRLTYLFVPPSETELNKSIIEIGGNLVDQKVIFYKTPQAHYEFSNNIFEYVGEEINEELVELALEAGRYSRFRIDSNFINNEFERLYTQWLINSINKTIAFKNIVAKSDNKIIGLVTIGRKENHAEIGLVSVDGNFRGKGIGTDLVYFADGIAYNMKFSEIKVITQLQNLTACRLYEKCKFQIESITNVYHLWR